MIDGKMRNLPALEEVSIGICTVNEGKNITGLLNNLLNEQKLAQNSEIVVVCSGSTDNTAEIVKDFCRRDKRVKLIIEEKRTGKSSAENIILDTYSGRFLYFIPADVLPAQFALPRLLDKMLSNPMMGVICGRPIPVNSEEGFAGYLVHLVWRLHHRTLKCLNDMNMDTHASSEMMLMRRGVVSKIPTDVVCDDAYIGVMAALNGFSVRYCEDAVVYIKAPTSVCDYITQRLKVIVGHTLVKQETNKCSPVLESMVFSSPGRVIGIILDEIRGRPKDVPNLLAAILIEVYVNLLAKRDLLQNKNHTVWKMAKTTKSMTEKEQEQAGGMQEWEIT